MKLASVETIRVELPFRFAFKHSLASRSSSDNLLVRVKLSDGTVGYGESIPRDYVTGETIEGAEKDVVERFGGSFIGLDVSDRSKVITHLQARFREFQLDNISRGAAWCALELAILDAVARAHKIRVVDWLGPPKAEEVRYGGVVPFGGKNVLVGILVFYRLYGFQTVKLKVGNDIAADVERLKMVRQIMGPEAIIRVDANCAWNLDYALSAAEKFRALGVASYEQPLPASDLKGLARFTAAIPEPVLADESLCTLSQAAQLAESRTVSGFNIRISKVGGLLAALEMAAMAKKHGLSCHMGAQVGESGILSAAGRIFACIKPDCDNYEGSDNAFLLRHDLTYENLTVGPGGRGRKLNGNGLGVNVIQSHINKGRVSRAKPRLAGVGSDSEGN